ncbi:hypothetical protein AB0N17_46460, partial [Streptomyces sp. NPDC051133]
MHAAAQGGSGGHRAKNHSRTAVAGRGVHAAAAALNGTFAYVANHRSNTVSVIDTATTTIPVGTSPTGVAIGPASTTPGAPSQAGVQ